MRYNSTLSKAAEAELPRDGDSGQSQGLIGLYLDGTVPRFYGGSMIGYLETPGLGEGLSFVSGGIPPPSPRKDP